MNTLTDRRPLQSYALLGLFLLIVIGVGSLIGVSTAPGAWYASLEKPPFNPPNWIFGPVWFALYVCIAVAGWRIATREPRSLAMGLWVGQMLLNWLWSPAFFSLQMLWPAAVIIVAMVCVIVAFIVAARRIDPLASWLFVPYLAWVSFATLLNVSIAVLN